MIFTFTEVEDFSQKLPPLIQKAFHLAPFEHISPQLIMA